MRNFLLDNATATGTTLSDVASLFRSLMSNIIGPVLAIIGVAAVIYAVVLGVNYAKAEDAEARKKVQGRLIGALIGAVIIVAGATLCFALDWQKIFENFKISKDATTTAIKAFLGR